MLCQVKTATAAFCFTQVYPKPKRSIDFNLKGHLESFQVASKWLKSIKSIKIAGLKVKRGV
jgi:hypothetical protein